MVLRISKWASEMDAMYLTMVLLAYGPCGASFSLMNFLAGLPLIKMTTLTPNEMSLIAMVAVEQSCREEEEDEVDDFRNREPDISPRDSWSIKFLTETQLLAWWKQFFGYG